MSGQNCDLLLPEIDRLTQEINGIDDQINALDAEGLELLNPLQYFKLRRTVDHLIKEQHLLQTKWNEAMEELAICRSSYPYNSG